MAQRTSSEIKDFQVGLGSRKFGGNNLTGFRTRFANIPHKVGQGNVERDERAPAFFYAGVCIGNACVRACEAGKNRTEGVKCMV